jgi:hypothetical protein
MLSRRDFLKLLAGTGASALLGKYEKSSPRVKRIYLFETNVAGFQYHEGEDPDVSALLEQGGDLILVREPANEYDEMAIAVYTQQGNKVGYVPRDANEIPAAIADQDVFIGAEIVSFDLDLVEEEPWNCLHVKIFEAIRIE